MTSRCPKEMTVVHAEFVERETKFDVSAEDEEPTQRVARETPSDTVYKSPVPLTKTWIVANPASMMCGPDEAATGPNRPGDHGVRQQPIPRQPTVADQGTPLTSLNTPYRATERKTLPCQLAAHGPGRPP